MKDDLCVKMDKLNFWFQISYIFQHKICWNFSCLNRIFI